MEEVKHEEQLLKDNKQKFLEGFKKLKLENDPMSGEVLSLRQGQKALEQLHRQGFIDQNANPT